MSSKDSFELWLAEQIKSVLEKKVQTPPLLIWCDPDREWPELLRTVSTTSDFELWAEPDEHELLLRDRFYTAERKPRVVWLPCSKEHITWFKVFELEAEFIWEKTLLSALREYGVNIPGDMEQEIKSLLSAHAREWFSKPKDTWKEFTPATAKGSLVDDRRLLQILAGKDGEFEILKKEDKFSIFSRRAVEDFGLPDPKNMDEKSWRIAATARFLCTEAAKSNPDELPPDREKIIPAGLPRDRALKLLKSWQENIHYIPDFEKLVTEADKTTGLTYWARNLSSMPGSYSSRAVEETIFKKTVDKLDLIEDVYCLTEELCNNLQIYKDREKEFWGSVATQKIGWNYLVSFANSASLIVENNEIEKSWKTSIEGIRWYETRGWQLDLSGETLFVETPDMPQELHRIRARLRRTYLRTVDSIGRVFSELLENNNSDLMKLPTSGEILLTELNKSKEPVALIYLDAFRLDLGARLAELINQGEPAIRAKVSTAIAPVPTITPLGMAFSLPIQREKLNISYDKSFQVTAEGFDGNLTVAEERRKWLTSSFQVKDFLTINEVMDSDKLKKSGKSRKIIIIYGNEIDKEGHEGQLELAGATENLERYARGIRKLREAGYNRIIVGTDHGFFHWQPETDEIEDIKPSGDLLWTSRRAMIGYNLKHKNAIKLPVPCSNLEAMVPRSTNAFKTYGGLGFFHGGATLQELVIPVVTIKWPVKGKKIDVVLKPVGSITSEVPRVQVAMGGQADLFGTDENLLARNVIVKIHDKETGKVIFKHKEPVTVEPGGGLITIQLKIVEPKPSLSYGSALVIEVRDAEDEELLTKENITLKVDIDEW